MIKKKQAIKCHIIIILDIMIWISFYKIYTYVGYYFNNKMVVPIIINSISYKLQYIIIYVYVLDTQNVWT